MLCNLYSQELTLDEEGMTAIRASDTPVTADAVIRATRSVQWSFVVRDPIVISMI